MHDTPAQPAPLPAAPARQLHARHVAVDGRAPGEPASARRRTRRVLRQALSASALRSVFEQLPLIGALVMGQAAAWWWLSGPPGGGESGWIWLWLAASTALGAAMMAWPRRHRRAVAGALLSAAVALAGLLPAVPAAWQGLGGPWALVLGSVASALAAAASPRGWVAAPAAAAPLLAWVLAIACAQPADLAAALWCSAVASALAWRLHRRWRSQALQAVDQSDKLQAVAADRDAALRNDRDKSRFLAIASHDLRQPVHALGLFAATLHKRLMNSADEPLGRNLMRSVDGLERSFNAMLDISRLDGGAVTPRLHSFPLRDLFRRLHMQYGGQAELAGLGLRFSPGGKSVTSDPQLLERILGNLVQNAIRYTTAGGVVVVARTTQTHVNIEVWDTGSGIAPDNLPRVFEEFFQVGRGERDRSQGLGMGLAIVKRLAALLGHRLEVLSAPGRGTVFRLGVQLGHLDGLDEETAAADTVPMSVDLPQMVLVVDDEEPIREGLRLLLQEWGYQVMAAADAAQAERAVSALEGRIDLVLTDLHLGPGPGGQDVVAQVRRLCGRHVPAILVTGDTAGEALRAVAGGADPVMFKPVQPRHLFEAMRAALEVPAASPD